MQALLRRTKEDKTFDVDVSLAQFNIWYVRQGTYAAEVAAALRERHKEFTVRHWDEMQSLITKTHAALNKVRPELFQRQDYFWKMPGKDWGVDEEISILRPAFALDGVELGYAVPSGRKGRDVPAWIA